jgi:citrate synthase
MSKSADVIHSRIWEEVAEPDDPFTAAACYCAGYDVYGEVLGNSRYVEYLYLLFTQERPRPEHVALLEALCIALANAGPRDHAVRAAMSAGVGGSSAAASVMAALAAGAGQLGGAREVALSVQDWLACGRDLERWRSRLRERPAPRRRDVWPEPEHPPGFAPHGRVCATPLVQALEHMSCICPGGALEWLRAHREALQDIAGMPLAWPGLAAAAMVDLELDQDQAEMLYLLLRLPGAAAHALEQREQGWRRYPFFAGCLELLDDPEKPASGDDRGEASRGS